MSAVSFAIMALGCATGGLLLTRAARAGLFWRFPFFYSYVAFALMAAVVTYAVFWFLPQLHARVFWWKFLVTVLAEFAVIVEVSDHVFEPYPAIRGLGRILVVSVTVILFMLYVLPSLAGYPSSRAFLLGLVKKAAALKAAALLLVLAVARRYRLQLGRNISGMALGFCVYLGISSANFAVAEKDVPKVYEAAFRLITPLSFTLALLIWAVALWSYQPAAPTGEQLGAAECERGGDLSYQLDRMNNALGRLLGG